MLLRRNAPVGSRPLELSEPPTPEPGAGEILVRVTVCGVCRTDLHVIRVGDRVGVAWLRHTCGGCEYCASGRENLCASSRYTGYHADGGYAEYAVAPEAFSYAIPETFDDRDAAPLLCGGIIGYRALRRSEISDGGRLGLYGFGSSAHVVMQIAKHRGCEVYVATRGESHRELARKMGADWVGGTFDEPPLKLDAAIVFAPAGAVVPAALRAVDKGGTVALAGIYMTPLPEMDYESCLFHEKKLCSVEANTRQDGNDLLREAAEIPIRPEVTTFDLERANDALIALKDDRINGTALLLC